MIEINLKPKSTVSDEIKLLLSPALAHLLNYSFQNIQQATTDKELLLWGNIWASLLYLRQDGLQPGFSQADTFAKNLIMTNDLDLLFKALYNK